MSDIEWPSLATTLAVHDAMLEHDGGLAGPRDRGLLEAALAQPLQSFSGDDLFPGAPGKAARLASGVIKNHPFPDASKRTGAALLGVVLMSNGLDLPLKAGELADAVLRVASGEWGFETW